MEDMGNKNVLNGAMIKRMFFSGACLLESNKYYINELNVFPVPDGDTGTNMSLTVQSAKEALEALAEDSTASVLKAISSGSLRGARGNSGVILSQLFRGFSKAVKEEDIDTVLFAAGMERAVETAYKAVMKPKEGTILTVARRLAEEGKAAADSTKDFSAFFDTVLKAGEEALKDTPNLLPVLKEAGVVDSGGEGLMTILRGCVDAFHGRDHVDTETIPEHAEILHQYEISFAFKSKENDRNRLEEKIAQTLQALKDVTGISDMKLTLKTAGQNIVHDTPPAVEDNGPRKAHAFLAVSCGDGISSIFKELGVDEIIEGGQTMNPSTDDLLSAVERANADEVYLLPNNKNIILAANQAATLTDQCRVIVIPTKTIPQGITAVVSFVPDATAEENRNLMTKEIEGVSTGEVTYAVRDTSIDGQTIRKGDIMGIGDGQLLSVGKDTKDVILAMLEKMVSEDSELISLYFGADLTDNDCVVIEEAIRERYPALDVEGNKGGQPVYYCILSVE